MLEKRILSAAALAAAALVALPSHAAGLKVVKDPVTGELRAPTAEESADLDAAQPRSQAQGRSAATGNRGMVSGRVNPGPVVRANGTVQHELDESTMSYSVVKRSADGTLNNYCVTGDKAAKALVRSRVAPVSQAKEGGLELK